MYIEEVGTDSQTVPSQLHYPGLPSQEEERRRVEKEAEKQRRATEVRHVQHAAK